MEVNASEYSNAVKQLTFSSRICSFFLFEIQAQVDKLSRMLNAVSRCQHTVLSDFRLQTRRKSVWTAAISTVLFITRTLFNPSLHLFFPGLYHLISTMILHHLIVSFRWRAEKNSQESWKDSLTKASLCRVRRRGELSDRIELSFPLYRDVKMMLWTKSNERQGHASPFWPYHCSPFDIVR